MPPKQLQDLLRRVRRAQQAGLPTAEIERGISMATNGQIGDIRSLITQATAPLEAKGGTGRGALDRAADPFRKAAQTASFGFADELIGGLGAILPGGRTPAEGAERFREKVGEFEEEQPGAAMAAGLAGALLPTGAALKLAKGGTQALRGALRLPSFGKPAVSAAQAGAKELAARAAAIGGKGVGGGLLKGVGRVALPGAARGAAIGAGAVGLEAAGSAEGGVGERLGAAKEAVLSPGGFAAGLAGGVLGGLARVASPAGADLLHARRIARETAPARLGRVGKELAGGAPVPPSRLRRAADNLFKEVRETHFKPLEEAGVLNDSQLIGTIQDSPQIREAAEEVLKRTGRSLDDPKLKFVDVQDIVGTLNRKAREGFGTEGARSMGRAFADARDALNDALDATFVKAGGGSFSQEARQAWATAVRVPDAIEDGLRLARSGTIDDITSAVSRHSNNPETLHAFRTAMLGDLLEEIGEKAAPPRVTDRFLARARAAFGDEDAVNAFVEALNIENRFARAGKLEEIAVQALSFKGLGSSLFGRLFSVAER